MAKQNVEKTKTDISIMDILIGMLISGKDLSDRINKAVDAAYAES